MIFISFFFGLKFPFFVVGSSKFRVISESLVILYCIPASSQSEKNTEIDTMAKLFTTARPSLLFVSSINPSKTFLPSVPNSLSFSFAHRPRPLRCSEIRSSRPLESESDPEDASAATKKSVEKPGAEDGPESPPGNAPAITDEWGEKSETGPEESGTRFADSDPPTNEDEWEERNVGEAEVDAGNGSAVHDRTGELKRCLADTVYGTELGFRADSEVRAEVLELVNQLEALNPTPAPVENPELLDGNWVLL